MADAAALLVWAFLGTPLKANVTADLNANPGESACLPPVVAYCINCRNLRLKTYCLDRKNRKRNSFFSRCEGKEACTLT